MMRFPSNPALCQSPGQNGHWVSTSPSGAIMKALATTPPCAPHANPSPAGEWRQVMIGGYWYASWRAASQSGHGGYSPYPIYFVFHPAEGHTSPRAVLLHGAPDMETTNAWQLYQGDRIAALDGVPQGAVVEAEMPTVGIVHLHKHPSGKTLIYGPKGIGAPIGIGAGEGGGGQTTDGALLAALQMMFSTDQCSGYGNPAGNPGVRAFQAAWNNTSDPNMGTPALTVDGKYGPNTAQAASQANGSSVPGPCANVGPSPQPQPPPGPPPAPIPTPAAPTNYVPWVLGGLGILALAGVGYAVMKKPSSKEMKGTAKHHDRQARHHRLHAHHMRRMAHHRAREEAREAHA